MALHAMVGGKQLCRSEVRAGSEPFWVGVGGETGGREGGKEREGGRQGRRGREGGREGGSI